MSKNRVNLTGRWIGKYKYGEGYSEGVIGTSEPFEFIIQDNDGAITGSCIDKIVKAVIGNSSSIVGTFKDNFLSFHKTYKNHLAIDESGSFVQDNNATHNGVYYVGSLRKKFFSKKIYFIGEWQITSEFVDEHMRLQTYSVSGTWKMSRM